MDPDTYGVDWDGPIPADADEVVVEIPPIPTQLSESELDDLVMNVDPLASSDFMGADIYLTTLEQVQCYNTIV